jgi:hypothetical protein
MVGKVIVPVCGIVGTCGKSRGIVCATTGAIGWSSLAMPAVDRKVRSAVRGFNGKYSSHHGTIGSGGANSSCRAWSAGEVDVISS